MIKGLRFVTDSIGMTRVVCWALFLCFVLSACATYPSGWSKAGAGDRELKHDSSFCMARAKESQQYGGLVGSHERRDAFVECMEGEGWASY